MSIENVQLMTDIAILVSIVIGIIMLLLQRVERTAAEKAELTAKIDAYLNRADVIADRTKNTVDDLAVEIAKAIAPAIIELLPIAAPPEDEGVSEDEALQPAA